MENWSLNHDLVYVFVCVSYLADGEIDDSEKDAMRGNIKVTQPNLSDGDYDTISSQVVDEFIALGNESARSAKYTESLNALKSMFDADEGKFKLIKNLAYIARADEFIHENEMAMIEEAITVLDMVAKVNIVKTDSTLYVDFRS